MAPLLLLAFALAAQDKPPDPCTISGTVVNSVTGEPLNKVEVSFERTGSSSHTATTTTDASGRFTMVDLDPGSYHLRGKRNGYLDTAYGARRADSDGTTVRLDAGQTLGDLKLKLMPYAVIAGTIRDSDGEPLADASVNAARISYENGKPHLENYTSIDTDDLGQYRIRELPPGKYYVRAKPPTQSWGRVDHSTDGAKRDDTVATVYPGSANPAMAAPVEVRTGARVNGIDITLARVRTFTVSGRVVTASGAGVGEVSVWLGPQGTGSDFDGVGMGSAARNQRGDFVIRGVPSGSYTLSASKDDLRGSVPVQVGNAPVEGVRVVLGAGASLRFRVASEGDRKADTTRLHFMVTNDGRRGYFLDTNGKSMFGPSVTISPDHYQIRPQNVPVDFYVKSIRAPETDVLADGLTVPPGASLELDVVLASDGGKVEGTVTDASGNPSAGATVLLVPEPRLRTRADLYRTVATDQYGHYELTAVPPGDYKLFAWDDIESGIWFDPAFLAEREKKGADVTVRTGASQTAKLETGD